MVIKDENPIEPGTPGLPQPHGDADAPVRPEPGQRGPEGVEATGGAEPAGPRGGFDSSGLLGISRALEEQEEMAVNPAELPPDAPVAPAIRSGAGRAEESTPAPLDALDALGVVGPAPVRLLSPQGGHAPGESDDPSGETAPDPAPQFQTIFRQAVLDEIREHAESQEKVEVCGVLVGSVYENSSGAFAYVEGSIRGTYAAGRSAQVTFTAETWQHIDREMDERFPGRKIVGWYHTHPGFGIFLSEMDLFIQRHFFNAPWQTAFVYDPQSKERGLFGWNGAEIVRQTFVLDNELGPAVTESAGPNLSPKAHGLEGDNPAGGPPGTAAELTARIKLLEQRQRYMLVGMAALMLVAVVWPLVVLVAMSSPDSGGAAGAPAPVAPSPAVDHPESAVSQGAGSATAELP